MELEWIVVDLINAIQVQAVCHFITLKGACYIK